MAHTVNYNKVCPACDGNPYRFIKWERYWFIFVRPIYRICRFCGGAGFIKPKKVIQRLDEFEPEVIY